MEPKVPRLEWPGLVRTRIPIDCEATIFDLTLQIIEEPTGLICHFNYSTALFDAATIARMATRFRALLEAIIAYPDQRLLDLPLLTIEEREELLVAWNQTTGKCSEARVHELFEEHVRRQPNAIAVVHGEERSPTNT